VSSDTRQGRTGGVAWVEAAARAGQWQMVTTMELEVGTETPTGERAMSFYRAPSEERCHPDSPLAGVHAPDAWAAAYLWQHAKCRAMIQREHSPHP
jgi:hypothetical protein